jgi:hypothetical protein
LALDLDGTLIGKDLILSPRVRGTISAAVARGAQVTLVTGRMFQSTLPFAQELGVTLPLICYQGALIRDPVSREVLYHQPVPLPLARQVIQVVRQWGLHVNVYVDDELYVERLTPEAERYGSISKVPIHLVGDLLSFLSTDPTKLVIVSDEATIDRAVRELQSHFGEALYVTESYPIFCEIAHPGCNKGRSLEWLAARYGFPREEVLAIGDGPNDVEMIRWAGLGIAMGNAPEEVRAAADWVTGTVQEEGAALALERFLLLSDIPRQTGP